MVAISTAQMRMMYGLARKAGMDDDMLHTLVKGRTGCDSIKALNIHQGRQIIDRLRELCGEPPKDAANRATTAQQGKIFALARELGWGDDPKRLRAFLTVRFKVTDPKWLTASQAGPVIEALKAMRDGGRGERRSEG